MTAEKPAIFIEPTAWNKIKALCDACEGEVGGYMLVRELPSAPLVITDILVPEQEVTGASVDLEAANWLANMLSEAETQFGREVDAEIRGSWHSHGNMGAFASGIDTNAFAEWLRASAECPYIIELITNKRHEYKIFYEQAHPIPFRIDCDLVQATPPNEWTEWAKGVKEAKVKAKSYAYNQGQWDNETGTWKKTGNPTKALGAATIDTSKLALPSTVNTDDIAMVISQGADTTILVLKDGTEITHKGVTWTWNYKVKGKNPRLKANNFDTNNPKAGDCDGRLMIMEITSNGTWFRVRDLKNNKEFSTSRNPLLGKIIKSDEEKEAEQEDGIDKLAQAFSDRAVNKQVADELHVDIKAEAKGGP